MGNHRGKRPGGKQFGDSSKEFGRAVFWAVLIVVSVVTIAIVRGCH